MKEKSIVMKMLFKKLNAAFSGSGHPSYRITVDEGKTGVIEVTDRECESVYFDVIYDEDVESFIYAGDNIDSATLRTLVEIEDAIAEEYPYPEETVEYSIYCNRENNPDDYEPWCDYTTLEEATEEMNEFKARFHDRDFYILKTTTIEERVIVWRTKVRNI